MSGCGEAAGVCDVATGVMQGDVMSCAAVTASGL